MCERCGASAKTKKAAKALEGRECRGHPALRGENGDETGGHALMQTGSLVWCLMCGQHSAKIVRGLALRCWGRAHNTTAETGRRRLLRGRHPLRGAEILEGEPTRAGAQAWRKLLGEPERDRAGECEEEQAAVQPVQEQEGPPRVRRRLRGKSPAGLAERDDRPAA